jgi:CheY-like chemotaxis protein
MAKKVLIIEESLAVRGVAESLLRQNGFEVVSADSPSGAMDILGASKIDLILVSSELTADSGQPLYEQFTAQENTAAVPILILHDPNSGPEPAYPPESIIAKPFTPRDFLAAIGPFVGAEQTVSTSDQTPFSGADFEDALIDSALGLDKIEVDDAEVMQDDTGIYRRQNKKGITESLIGLDIKVNPDDTTKAVRGKIESVNVPADAENVDDTPPPADDEPEKTEEPAENVEQPQQDAGLTESSKIEIITDQYGIAAIPEPSEIIQPDDEDKAHDYEWFLSELRREASGEKAKIPDEDVPVEPQVSLDEKPAEAKAAPQPKKPAEKTPEPKAKSKESATHGEAIDKFISEFKKEVDKITGDAADQITVSTIAADDSDEAGSRPADDLNWEERLEKIPEDQIKQMSQEIVDALAKQVARQLVSRIDPDVVYHLIKAALDARSGREKKKPTPQA